MIFILSLSMFIHAGIKCPNNRVIISTPCYGECGNFFDENSNGICDIWEEYNKENNDKKIVIKKNIKTQNIVLNNLLEKTTNNIIIENDSNTTESEEKKNNNLTRYGFVYIFIINIFLIVLTEIFQENIGANFLRRFWNRLFLISMLSSILTGFFLYFNILNEQRNILYPLHIQSGLISTICALYHIAKRYKYL